MNAIDTNIWIYSHDVRDGVKQQMALDLIARTRPLALPWQVGCEFIAAGRKLAPFGFDEQQAWASLDAMKDMADVVLLPTPSIWSNCRKLMTKHPLSFWDGMLISACLAGGVTTLFSEDLPGTARIDGITFVNPFAAA